MKIAQVLRPTTLLIESEVQPELFWWNIALALNATDKDTPPRMRRDDLIWNGGLRSDVLHSHSDPHVGNLGLILTPASSMANSMLWMLMLIPMMKVRLSVLMEDVYGLVGDPGRKIAVWSGVEVE